MLSDILLYGILLYSVICYILMYHILFIHLRLQGYLGFQFLVTIKKSRYKYLHTSLCVNISFICLSKHKSGIAEFYHEYVQLYEKLTRFPKMGITILPSHHHWPIRILLLLLAFHGIIVAHHFGFKLDFSNYYDTHLYIWMFTIRISDFLLWTPVLDFFRILYMFWIHVLCQLCLCKYFIPLCVNCVFIPLIIFHRWSFYIFLIKFNFYLPWIVLLVSRIRTLPNRRSQHFFPFLKIKFFGVALVNNIEVYLLLS